MRLRGTICTSAVCLLAVLCVTVNGHCIHGTSLILGGKSCVCENGWTGDRCQLRDCKNGGVSLSGKSGIYCKCGKLWTGPLCEMPECIHGKWDEVHRMCSCDRFYAGNHCNQVTKCIEGTLLNGVCSCHHGFQGDFCSEPTHDSTVDYILGAAIGVVVLLGVIGIGFLVCCRNKLYPGRWISRNSSTSLDYDLAEDVGVSRRNKRLSKLKMPSREQSTQLTTPA